MRRLAIYFGTLLFSIGSLLNAQGIYTHPEEDLTWNVSEYEAHSGAQWLTAQFPTQKGALYTLVSSSNLEDWLPIHSFYALGSNLHLALFELEQAPMVEPPEDPEEDNGEPPAPVVSVSFRLHPLANNSGTAVTWSSLDEHSSLTGVHRVLPFTLDDAWSQLPFYFEKFDDYFFFLVTLSNHPAPTDFVETALEDRSPEDIAVFDLLSANFSAIQTELIARVAENADRPIPPPPHPDSKRFYRLERTLPDSDGNGLSDYLEFQMPGYDPFNEDSDGNGIRDGQEDSDGDGAGNFDEIADGSDPLDSAVRPPLRLKYLTISSSSSHGAYLGPTSTGGNQFRQRITYFSVPYLQPAFPALEKEPWEPAINLEWGEPDFETAADLLGEPASFPTDMTSAWWQSHSDDLANFPEPFNIYTDDNSQKWFSASGSVAFHGEAPVPNSSATAYRGERSSSKVWFGLNQPLLEDYKVKALKIRYEVPFVDTGLISSRTKGTPTFSFKEEVEVNIPAGHLFSDGGVITDPVANEEFPDEGIIVGEFLLPVEVAPEVLGVNSDFDEGRIDPATGYAIPDCDDVPGLDRKKGSGNTLVSLNAARDHLDNGNIATGKPVTDDLHQGWFGVNPNQLGDDFWDGANVTIKKVDQVDPDTGRQESGQIRFYAKWGDQAGESIGIIPYDFQSLQATNLVAGGVHGGGSVYGSASSLPDDAEFWMEGVRPGKITLEWRLQKGDIDVKHEQTFDVVTEQSVADWRNEIRYQIRLQTSVAGNEVDIEQFNPNAEFLANDPFIQAIYAWYEQTFKESDDDMKWAGMAKMAGAPVYAALKDAQLGRALAPGVGAGATARSMQTALMVGNRDIFMDLAWQHRAYAASGIFGLKFVDDESASVNPPVVPLNRWQEIDQGVWADSHFKASRGASFLLRREQQFVVNPVYISIIQLGLAEIISILAENPIPNRNFMAQLGKSFQEVVPGGNLAEFDERWNWIEQDMYPNWTNISAFALSLNVDLASDIGGYSKQTRCDEATIPLVQRAQTYTQNPF